jgi:mannose-6-phosphate isomerase-like protein (cupin superfamily)
VHGEARSRRGDGREEASVTNWETAHLSEIEPIPVPDTLAWTPVRRHFGIQAFGVNAYTAAEAGQEVVERHTEDARKHEELYIVIAGRATFTVDGFEALREQAHTDLACASIRDDPRFPAAP